MMTIDNLPAQLPRDASQYFGDALSPLLRAYIDKGMNDEYFKRAAITIDGQISDNLKSSLQPLIDNIFSKNILIIGAGLVSGPVIQYLSQFPEYSITVVSPTLSKLDNPEKTNIRYVKAEIKDGHLGQVESAIQEADLVISLLPATMHSCIIESVARNGKHLITASYTSPQMESFKELVKERNLIWLNEVGLDPGLDHMSAMKLIDESIKSGNHVESFVSWCGGLPAPECADNPLGYKFSWSPRGALLATQNSARYLENGREINIDGSQLLKASRPIKLHPAFSFEGLPNRDSIKYVDKYGLHGIGTMFRGTLRYSGFSEFMEGMTRLGFLDQLPCKNYGNWRDFLAESLQISHFNDNNGVDWLIAVQKQFPDWSKDKCVRFINNLSLLGILSTEGKDFKLEATKLDTLCNLLQSKLCYGQGERDMVFMHHELIISPLDGQKMPKQVITSTLCMFGNSEKSAMSLTVGLPVAVAARLILKGVIKKHGLLIPTSKEIYEPMLSELERLGIRFVEKKKSLLQ